MKKMKYTPNPISTFFAPISGGFLVYVKKCY